MIKYIRKLEVDYDADISAAEARGRASVQVPIVPFARTPTVESERIAKIESLGCASQFPDIIAQAKLDGSSVDATAEKLLTALVARKKVASPNGSRNEGGAAAEPVTAIRNSEDAKVFASQVSQNCAKVRAHRDRARAAGRRLTSMAALRELHSEGALIG